MLCFLETHENIATGKLQMRRF